MRQIDTIVLVNDIKESDRFYRENFNLEILHNWETMIVYKNRFSIHQRDKILPEDFAETLPREVSGGVIIYLELEKGEKLEPLLERLKSSGIKVIHEIYSLPWQRILRVMDPDNNIIEIGEPSE